MRNESQDWWMDWASTMIYSAIKGFIPVKRNYSPLEVYIFLLVISNTAYYIYK